MKPALIILKYSYAICRCGNDSSIPKWLDRSDFYSLTRTPDELSIICNQEVVEPDEDLIIDKNWQIIKVNGPLDLSLIGIIADISLILKKSKIPVFIISSYDTDYFLVKEEKLDKAVVSLKNNGYKILPEK